MVLKKPVKKVETRTKVEDQMEAVRKANDEARKKSLMAEIEMEGKQMENHESRKKALERLLKDIK